MKNSKKQQVILFFKIKAFLPIYLHSHELDPGFATQQGVVQGRYPKCGIRNYNLQFSADHFELNFLFSFLKMGQSRPLFAFILVFSTWHNSNTNWWSVDGVLGTWTQDGRIEGADESSGAMVAPRLVISYNPHPTIYLLWGHQCSWSFSQPTGGLHHTVFQLS